jgi:hypothetical protein
MPASLARARLHNIEAIDIEHDDSGPTGINCLQPVKEEGQLTDANHCEIEAQRFLGAIKDQYRDHWSDGDINRNQNQQQAADALRFGQRRRVPAEKDQRHRA